MNRTLVRLLVERRREMRERYHLDWQITGVASRRLGWIADSKGLDPSTLCTTGHHDSGTGRQVTDLSPSPDNVHDWLAAAKADVLFEATSLNAENGQPAIDHIRAALELGAHAITANKGTVVYGHEPLVRLAKLKGRQFLFESTVMDGVPIFALFRDNLPTVHLKGFRGVLNSTTNVILSGMEEGLTFEQSLAKAQQLGVAETDPSYDIDGWDASVKVAALATVLMGVPLKPGQVKREGIRQVAALDIVQARKSGLRYKLVCRATRTSTGISASVAPERLPFSDPLAQVAGTSSIICFETDIFSQLVITEHDPGLDATAYGMLSDFIRAVGMEQHA